MVRRLTKISPQGLVEQFAAAHAEFLEVVRGATPEQWRAKGINHPTIRVGNEDEGRPVGVIVHHVAQGYLSNRLRCIAWIRGEDVEPPGPETNRRHAAEHPDPDQAETLRLLDAEGTELQAFMSRLSEADLAAQGTFVNGSTTTVEDLLGRLVPFHIRWHQGSIQATWDAMAASPGN